MAEIPINEAEAGEETVEAPPRVLPEHPVLAGLFEQFADVEWRLSGDQDTAVVPQGPTP